MTKQFGQYTIHESGKVISHQQWRGTTERTINPIIDKGVTHVWLSHDGTTKRYALAKLMAKLFFGPPQPEKPCVMHLDGDRSNNNITNLCYTETNEGNMINQIQKLLKLYGPPTVTKELAKQIKAILQDAYADQEHNIKPAKDIYIQTFKEGLTDDN